MEEDRIATNLGPDLPSELNGEQSPVPKQPKKRFVGRRTAAEAAGSKATPNESIEDSGAIQGKNRKAPLYKSLS